MAGSPRFSRRRTQPTRSATSPGCGMGSPHTRQPGRPPWWWGRWPRTRTAGGGRWRHSRAQTRKAPASPRRGPKEEEGTMETIGAAPGPETIAEPSSGRERFEGSRAGRAVLTVLLVVTLGAMILSNLPDSQLRRSGLRLANPYLDLTGLHQNWNLF